MLPGDGLLPTRVFDISAYLKRGLNVVAVEHERFSRFGENAFLGGRLFITDKAGKNYDYRTDRSWSSARKYHKDWTSAEFDYKLFKPVKVLADITDCKETYFNWQKKRDIGDIMFPPVCGRLEPLGDQKRGYIFKESGGIDFKFKVRGAFSDRAKVKYKLVRTYPDNKETAEGLAEKTGSGELAVKVKNLKPGVFHLFLTLHDNGKDIESAALETILAGKIKQPEIEGKNYFDGLKTKETDYIDCAKEPDRYFLEASMLRKNNIKSSVKEYGAAGLARELGPENYFENASMTKDMAHIEYFVRFGKRGAPHVIEIEYPDVSAQSLGARIVEPLDNNLSPEQALAAPKKDFPFNAARISWGFASGGRDYPSSGKTAKERFIYFPSCSWGAVLIANLNMRGSSAVKSIRVYEIEGELPQVKINNEAKDRLFGYFPENPAIQIPYSYFTGDRNTINPKDWKFFTVPGLGSRNYGKIWYQSLENLIKWMRFSGNNCYYWDAHMYDRLCYPVSETNVFFCPGDYISIAAAMFEENSLNLMLGIEFESTNSLNAAEKSFSNKEILDGKADTAAVVDKDGVRVMSQTWYVMNSFHPRVKAEYLRIVRHLAAYYKDCPAIKGIIINAGRFCTGGPAAGPGVTIADTPFKGSYDDSTIASFEKYAKIKIPASEKPSSRFKNRQHFIISNPEVKEKWIDFRCEDTAKLCASIEAEIKDAAPEMHCLFTWTNNFYQFWSGCEIDKAQHFKNSASDLPQMKGPYVNGLNYSMLPDRVFYGGGNYRDFQNQDMTDFLKTEKTLLGLQTLWYEWGGRRLGQSVMDGKQKWFWGGDLQTVYEARPSERYFNDALAQALTGPVPYSIHYGVGDCNSTTGSEHAMRNFAKVFRTLPTGVYKTLSSGDCDKNIVIRSLSAGEWNYLLLINPLPYDSAGEISLSKYCSEILNLAENTVSAGDKIKLFLSPFQIKSFRLPASASVSSAVIVPSAEAKSEAAIMLKDIEGRQKFFAGSSARDKTASELVGQMKKMFVDGNFSALRKLYFDRRLSPAKTPVSGIAQEWSVIGPFGAEKNTDALKRVYPVETDLLKNKAAKSYPSDLTGSAEFKIIKTARDDSGCSDFIDFKYYYPYDWAAVYAVTEVFSACAQNAWLMLGSDDGIKVWLDDKDIFSLSVLGRSARPGQNCLNVRLKQGWNRFIVKISQNTGDWAMYFSICKSQYDLSPPNGIKYRAPQFDKQAR